MGLAHSGAATVNGSTGAVLNVKPGDTVTLTADTTKFPENEEFGWWEITPYGSVSNTLTGQYQRTATFTMPSENVSARAMSKSAGVSTGGDDGGGGGGAAILLVGGAAVAGLVGYGVYSYVSEQQLKALLPEGVAMPENRAQTACCCGTPQAVLSLPKLRPSRTLQTRTPPRRRSGAWSTA